MRERITMDDLSAAWAEVSSEFEYRDKGIMDGGIRIIFPNETYYEISAKQVYSNRKVFSLNVDQSLKAINLTVEYLKQEGQNHD